MAQIERGILRGLLVPERRMEWWDAESGEYNAGARLGALPTGGALPGLPEPQSDTDLVLRATGTQSRGGRRRVRTQRGGFSDRNGAAFIHKDESDSAWYGWNTPNLLTGWDPIQWTSSSGSAWYTPHAVTLPSGDILGVCVEGTTTPEVRWFRRGAVLGTWTSATLIAVTSAEANPCLCLLPNGRVLLFYWNTDATTDKASIGMYFSDDDGATWTEGADGVIPETVSTSSGSSGYILQRVRAAYKDGQILLVACVQSRNTALSVEDHLIQYASSDLGHTFVEVDRTTPDSTFDEFGGGYQDVLVADGRFVVAWISLDDDLPRIVRLGSAYASLFQEDPIQPCGPGTDAATEVWAMGGDFFTEGDLCLFVDEAETLYMTGRQPSVGQEWIVVRSIDGGVTWAAMARSTSSSGVGKWWDAGDTGTYPADACAVFHRGRAVVIHGHQSAPSTYDYSLSASYLGGYSTITMPGYDAFRDDRNQVTYGITYLPFDLPGDCGWSSSGAGSESLASGVLRVTAGAGVVRWHTRAPSGSVDNGIITTAIVDPVAGTAYLLVRMDDGAEGYEVEVRVTTTAIEVYDAVAATQIGSTVTRTSGTEVQVLVAMKGDSVDVWYRLYATTTDATWIAAAGSSALTNNAGASGSNRVRFGAPSALVDRTLDWRLVAYIADEGGDYVGSNIVDFANPGDLFGRPYSSTGTYLADGVTIRAFEGPTQKGDQWNIDTRFDTPPENLLPTLEPSPREPWRSAPYAEFNASTTELRLAWRIDGDGSGGFLGADCALENDLIGFWIDGSNAPSITIDLYYGGAWNAVAATALHRFTGVREGNTLRPVASSGAGQKWRRGEAAGCGVGFYSGGGAGYSNADWTGTIERNTEGSTLTSAGLTKRPTFTIERTSGASTTTPNVAIWPRRHLVVVQASGFARAVRGVRLRIGHGAAGTYPGRPAQGYYEIAKFMAGSFAVFGFDYSWQRDIALDPNTELTLLDDGRAVSRVRGPSGRTVSVNWQDGVDLTGWRLDTVPDYVRSSANSGADPVAFWADLPFWLQDVVREFEGSHLPVVYAPYLPYDATSGSTGNAVVYSLGWGAGAIYGRVVSPVRIEQILGDEEVDDAYRVTSIDIREER